MNTEATALLLLDFQNGLGDQPWAAPAAARARTALAAARIQGLLVVFSKVGFDPGYLDICDRSLVFRRYRDDDLLPPSASRLIEGFSPTAGEALVDKDRFSPFAGSRLATILRAADITHVALCGISTSGVVLAAFTHGETEDLQMTILRDACADANTALHDTLTRDLFPRSAHVLTVDEWTSNTAPTS